MQGKQKKKILNPTIIQLLEKKEATKKVKAINSIK
jgi:hypothetical protein